MKKKVERRTDSSLHEQANKDLERAFVHLRGRSRKYSLRKIKDPRKVRGNPRESNEWTD